MTKIERLRKNFASGMSEARISDDSWAEEFLPMLEDAERYRWLRNDAGQSLIPKVPAWIAGAGNQYIDEDWLLGIRADEVIDSARKQTKETT